MADQPEGPRRTPTATAPTAADQAARAARRGDALRQNLARRKAQARARTVDDPGGPVAPGQGPRQGEDTGGG